MKENNKMNCPKCGNAELEDVSDGSDETTWGDVCCPLCDFSGADIMPNNEIMTTQTTPQEAPAQQPRPMQIQTIDRSKEEQPLLPSAHQIGDQVILRFMNATINEAFVRTVTFTASKVRYSIYLAHNETTLHNIDSAFVEEIKGPKGWIDFGVDNYS